MWLRLALNLAVIVLLSACSSSDQETVDKLNSLSYSNHYRNLDSTEVYAHRAIALSSSYSDGHAEALNHLAFVSMARMDYQRADEYLKEAISLTDNQIELFVAEVQQMRLCQRRSRNREFYEHRERAMECRLRINEERASLSERMWHRLIYAESEFAIVNSTYYYYVGLERQSIDALGRIHPNEVMRDTAQYLNYMYNIGAGGIITEGSQQEINQQEFDHLMRCFLLARHADMPFFAANALEALSEHLMEPEQRDQLVEDNLPAMKFLNPDRVDDDMLAGYLAESALYLFETYGDVYQIAGAYRTLASCYRQIGDYESALYNLEQALSDSAGIRCLRPAAVRRREGCHERPGRRPADDASEALFHLPPLAPVRPVCPPARSRRPRPAEAGLLLRRGPHALRRHLQGID